MKGVHLPLYVYLVGFLVPYLLIIVYFFSRVIYGCGIPPPPFHKNDPKAIEIN